MIAKTVHKIKKDTPMKSPRLELSNKHTIYLIGILALFALSFCVLNQITVFNHYKSTSLQPGCSQGTIYYNNSTYHFEKDILDETNGIAYGIYTDSPLHQSDFGVLRITTNSKYNDEQQSYAAGYLEAALTSMRIYDMFYD